MNKVRIAIKQLRGLVVETQSASNYVLATTLQAELMNLGYSMDEDLFKAVSTMEETPFGDLYTSVLTELRNMLGADVKHKPMYPNFPKEVMEASECELFANAILHYWTGGTWMPNIVELPRKLAFERTEYKMLTLATEDQFAGLFTKLLASNESISTVDKETVIWFINNYRDLRFPDAIPFKENSCIVAGMLLDAGQDISCVIHNATDVLRVATFLSDGDVSLAANTKFKSFSRPQRRALVNALDSVINAEDINRHRNKWTKLAHSLHVGDYSKKVYDIVKDVRENNKIATFNSKAEAAVASGNASTIVKLLSSRAGEFAKRLDHALRTTNESRDLITGFVGIIDDVPTRILLQLLGNLKTRATAITEKVVYPKGNAQKAILVSTSMAPLKVTTISRLTTAIQRSLAERFGKLDDLGKIWIDPALAGCPVPTAARSASESLFTVTRGTQLPIGDKAALRFFIYWKGQDIDLSATIHDENFETIGQTSYTRLRSSEFESCHSGDITYAPRGASEFIDINIDKSVASGARYVVMNVMVYSGPLFSEHEVCYAGWMTRNSVNSNEIFDPKTVQQKVDLRSQSKNCIPVVFDLVERKAIWADLTTRSRYGIFGNNVESNRATIEQNLKAVSNTANKVNLYELFELHAETRGELVATKEEADTVFSIDEGITPYDIATINSEYVT